MGWIGETDNARLAPGALLVIAPDPTTPTLADMTAGDALNIVYGLNRNMIAATISRVDPDGVAIAVEDGSMWKLTRAALTEQIWLVEVPG